MASGFLRGQRGFVDALDYFLQSERTHKTTPFKGLMLDRSLPRSPHDFNTVNSVETWEEPRRPPGAFGFDNVPSCRTRTAAVAFAIHQTAHPDLARHRPLSWLLAQSDGTLCAPVRRYILIHPEEVSWIVFRLYAGQPRVAILVRRTNAIFAFALHHEVYVGAAGPIRMQRLPVVF